MLRSFFSSDALRGPGHRESARRCGGCRRRRPAPGLGALSYAMKQVAQLGRPVGGSGGLPMALEAAFVAAGGEVQTGQSVVGLRCDGQRVRAVALADGTELEAATVVVACDPREVFVSWLRDPPAIDGLVDRWGQAPVIDGYESKVDAVVAAGPGVPPDRSAGRRSPRLRPAGGHDDVAPPTDGIEAAHRLMREGRVAERPMFFANVPSALDPTMRVGRRPRVQPRGALHAVRADGRLVDRRPSPSVGSTATARSCSPGSSTACGSGGP